jgi:hypothetical protein
VARVPVVADSTATLAGLAEEFWTWRVAKAPSSQDDVNRVERPPGWRSDWSAAAITERRQAIAGFARRHAELDLSGEPVAVQVDGRLLGSALARVHFELELLRGWQYNPWFYLDQSLGPIYQWILRPPPFDDERAGAIVAGLHNVAVVLSQAKENLAGHVPAPFARYVLRILSEVDGSVDTAMSALAQELPSRHAAELPAASRVASEALAGFRDWLTENLAGMGDAHPLGPDALTYFLHRVALLPYSARRLRETGQQEWDRAVAMEAVLRNRYRGASIPSGPADVAELVARQANDELAVRRFYDSLPVEGIAFYNEELMLQAGLFDDNPASAVFVANAMRLRALRVEVDLGLALGELTIETAADRLAEAVPMDRQTAWEEAVFFAGNPGQGLSYQIGKLQILDLLNTSAVRQGDSFDLQAFHDRLWQEGYVPLVLQRWESLGLRDQLDEADWLAGSGR